MTMQTENKNTSPDSENKSLTLLSTLKNKETTISKNNDLILNRQNNRYYIINSSSNVHYPALNGVICFYINHRQQSVMTRMLQPQTDSPYITETDLSLRTQLSQMEYENDILLAGTAHFYHGRMTHWCLSDKYSSQSEFHMSILKSPSINRLLPLHLIR
ncbi:MAG TPA: hypothetical protein DIT05_07870 [Morganella sp. (in: Bacteria)]|nr:hypothetical protein [Morganella sp. (in: enterobacteria)]